MADYLAIKDAWLAEDAMVTAGLLGRLRDNPIALYENRRVWRLKATGESTTSTTLQDDDDLYFSVGAGETWHVRFALRVTVPIHGGLRFKIVTPDAGDAGYCVGTMLANITAVAYSLLPACVALNTEEAVGHPDYVGASYPALLDVHLVTTAAGTVKLQWASFSGGNTTVEAGSLLAAHRLDEV
jgi:hypothetical protein